MRCLGLANSHVLNECCSTRRISWNKESACWANEQSDYPAHYEAIWSPVRGIRIIGRRMESMTRVPTMGKEVMGTRDESPNCTQDVEGASRDYNCLYIEQE